MLTEEEAKTRWCPFARVSSDGMGNRYPRLDDLSEGHAFARCIASECMAWRWEEMMNIDEGPPVMQRTGKGHCGLAGKP